MRKSAPGARGGALDAAELEFEVVGVRRVLDGLLVGDPAVLEQLEQRLVEGLAPVLDVAFGDGALDERGLLDVREVFLDRGRVDHDLRRGHAPLAVGRGEQAQRDDGLEAGGQLVAHLLVLVGRVHREDARHRLLGVRGVDGREDHVAGVGRGERDLDRLQVADFAHEHHVG